MSDSEWDWKASCDATEDLMRRALRSVMARAGHNPDDKSHRKGWVVSIQLHWDNRFMVSVQDVYDDSKGRADQATTLHEAFAALGRRLRAERESEGGGDESRESAKPSR